MADKRLAINLVANMISFGVNFGISLFLTPYIVKNVGSEAYGFIPLANNFITYVSIFTAALNSMASRFISIEINSKNFDKANKYFNSVLISNITIASILSLPSILITLNINKFLNVPNEILLDVKLTFAFIFINMGILLIGNVFSIATFAKNRLDLSSIRTIQGNIIRAIITIGLFVIFKPKIYFVTITLIIVTLYTIITNIHYTRRLLPEIHLNINDFDIQSIIILIKSGIWNSINQLSSVLLSGVDIIMANILISATVSGEYSIIKIVPNFIQSFVGMAVGVFIPKFIILYAKNEHSHLVDNVIKSTKVMGLLITLPIAFLIIFGDIFYSLWVPGEDIQKLQVLSIITIIPMIISGSINTLFNIYTVTNKLKIPSIVLLICGVINVVISILLIKFTNLGIFSIAITSSIIAIIRDLLFTPIYAAKCLELKWNIFYSSIVKGIKCSLVMMLVCIIIKNIFTINNWIMLVFAGILASMISIYININIMFSKKEKNNILESIYLFHN